jgi:hypothetical protein
MNGWQGTIVGADAKVADLQRVYAENRSRMRFPAEVASLLEQLDEEIAWRAVWLMCRLAEEGKLSERELGRVAESVDASRHWAWRLLVCQLFGRVACPADMRDEMFPFLQICFRDRRPIVRAWALTAQWLFLDDERYQAEIRRNFAEARKDPAKAMIARVRRLSQPRPGRTATRRSVRAAK